MNPTTARRTDAGLLAMAISLAAAYFLTPSLLSPPHQQDFPAAFTTYWNSGGPGFPPVLQHLVDEQLRLHLVRITIVLILLAVLLTLAARLPRFRLPIGALALIAAVLLIANVQGAVSPFATLLPDLKSHPAVQHQLRDQLTNGPRTPPLEVMLSQYRRWHVVKAVLVTLLTTTLIGLALLTWRRHRMVSLLTGALALGALVVAAANASTAACPTSPFLLLLSGD